MEAADGFDDQGFEGFDEREVVDSRCIVVGEGIAAEVVDDEIDRFEARVDVGRRFLCLDSHGGFLKNVFAYPTGVCQPLESGHTGGELETDVRFRVDLAPFLEAGIGFRVESIEPDVQMGDVVWPVTFHNCTHCCIGLAFEGVEIAVEFLEPR